MVLFTKLLTVYSGTEWSYVILSMVLFTKLLTSELPLWVAIGF